MGGNLRGRFLWERLSGAPSGALSVKWTYVGRPSWRNATASFCLWFEPLGLEASPCVDSGRHDVTPCERVHEQIAAHEAKVIHRVDGHGRGLRRLRSDRKLVNG